MEVNAHVSILVCNGGYMVRAWVQDEDEDWDWTFSAFSSIDVALEYARRVLMDMEGPDDDDGDDGVLPEPPGPERPEKKRKAYPQGWGKE